jgi:hypothetical protein
MLTLPSLSVALAVTAMAGGTVNVALSSGAAMLTAGGRSPALARAAAKMFRRPPDATNPTHCPERSTPLSSNDLAALTVKSGFWAKSRAAAPATCGVAMLVPLKSA